MPAGLSESDCRPSNGPTCPTHSETTFSTAFPTEKITSEDLYQLKLWRESNPEAPDGPWFKDFGSFKICGDGRYPKTFLLAGQAAKGQKL